MKTNKAQFTLQDIIPIVGIFVVAGIFAGYGLKVMGDVKTTFVQGQATTATCNATSGVYTGCGEYYNATADAVTGITKITGNMSTIGLITAAVIIIGMLGYLLMRK